jgi:hypothetical protein
MSQSLKTVDGNGNSVDMERPLSAPVGALHGVNGDQARALDELNIHTVYDLARWPPFLAAQRLLYGDRRKDDFRDPAIPIELQPRFEDQVTEKVYYQSLSP